MSDIHEDKEKTKIQKKLRNEGRNDFMESVDRMQPDELNAKMLELSKYNEEITNTMNADDALIQAKAKKTELERPYKKDKEMNKILRRYVALRLEEFGELGIQR